MINAVSVMFQFGMPKKTDVLSVTLLYYSFNTLHHSHIAIIITACGVMLFINTSHYFFEKALRHGVCLAAISFYKP